MRCFLLAGSVSILANVLGSSIVRLRTGDSLDAADVGFFIFVGRHVYRKTKLHLTQATIGSLRPIDSV